MKVIKKGQIAVLSLALMTGVALYINYKYDPNTEKNLSQTIYVNGKDRFPYDKDGIYDNKDSQENNDKTQASATSEDSLKSDASSKEDTLAVFKYDRDNMYSELSENYNNIIKNEKSTESEIKEYQKKLDDLITQKNLITMVENVIKAKGIENIVIIPTKNDNINVLVKSKEDLTSQQIAQIQQILVDQLGANAKKISIERSEEHTSELQSPDQI